MRLHSHIAFGVRITLLTVALCALSGWAVAASEPAATAKPAAEADVLAKEREENSMGLAAKLLASAVFISGRDPARVIEEDLTSPLYPRERWNATKVDIDRDARRVTLSTARTSRTAIFTGVNAQGSVLLPVGESTLRFTPREIPRQLPPADSPWPMGDRIDSAARPRGIDEAKLKAAIDSAFADTPEANQQHTRALVVVHKGQLIAERYAPGFHKDQPLIGWSMGKTIAAALAGVVADWKPALDLQAPAPIPQWQAPNDPRAKITLGHLMQMSAGLSCPSPRVTDPEFATSRNIHNSPYYGIVDAHAAMLSRPQQDPPGSRWQYCNANTFALAEIVKARVQARGLDYLTFPQHALFDRIGARSFVLETDLVGNFLITGYDYATARDWARFGELLRRDGVTFDGTRLLREGWVDFMRTPAAALKVPYYGGQVYLNADVMFKSVPRDAYFARGMFEQITLVIPSRETVVVRLGRTPDEKTMWAFYPYFGSVVAGVLDALPAK